MLKESICTLYLINSGIFYEIHNKLTKQRPNSIKGFGIL